MNKMELCLYYRELEKVLKLGKSIMMKSDWDEDMMCSIDAVNIEINKLKSIIEKRLDN